MNTKTIEKINALKKQRNAIILVHNYQTPEVQDVADFLGDSFGLSRKASQTNADVVVFCGVRFMAETASILCPKKIILLPDIDAGCPMADMIDKEGLRKLKKEHPKAVVVAYVNTPADVKAESDICCTSANAVKVVESLSSEKEIIFIPDKHLANYVSSKTNRKLITWNGYCPSHVKILAEDIIEMKKRYPAAEVVVHPECTSQVIKLADKALSTEGILSYAKNSSSKQMIVGTESGIIYRLEKENPDKKFYPASQLAVCTNMKRITLEKVLWSLETMKYEIRVSEEIRRSAISAVEKMIAIA